jgi:hypothetical protein
VSVNKRPKLGVTQPPSVVSWKLKYKMRKGIASRNSKCAVVVVIVAETEVVEKWVIS